MSTFSAESHLREHAQHGAVICERAGQADGEARRILTDFDRDFACALHILLYAFDAKMVVVGSSCTKSFRFWEGRLRERLVNFAYSHTFERLRIKFSYDPRIAILGAAALCLDAQT